MRHNQTGLYKGQCAFEQCTQKHHIMDTGGNSPSLQSSGVTVLAYCLQLQASRYQKEAGKIEGADQKAEGGDYTQFGEETPEGKGVCGRDMVTIYKYLKV